MENTIWYLSVTELLNYRVPQFLLNIFEEYKNTDMFLWLVIDTNQESKIVNGEDTLPVILL